MACIYLLFCYKIFDTIPEQFDKFRPRYSQELFDNLIAYAKIGPDIKAEVIKLSEVPPYFWDSHLFLFYSDYRTNPSICGVNLFTVGGISYRRKPFIIIVIISSFWKRKFQFIKTFCNFFHFIDKGIP